MLQMICSWDNKKRQAAHLLRFIMTCKSRSGSECARSVLAAGGSLVTSLALILTKDIDNRPYAYPQWRGPLCAQKIPLHAARSSRSVTFSNICAPVASTCYGSHKIHDARQTAAFSVGRTSEHLLKGHKCMLHQRGDRFSNNRPCLQCGG